MLTHSFLRLVCSVALLSYAFAETRENRHGPEIPERPVKDESRSAKYVDLVSRGSSSQTSRTGCTQAELVQLADSFHTANNMALKILFNLEKGPRTSTKRIIGKWMNDDPTTIAMLMKRLYRIAQFALPGVTDIHSVVRCHTDLNGRGAPAPGTFTADNWLDSYMVFYAEFFSQPRDIGRVGEVTQPFIVLQMITQNVEVMGQDQTSDITSTLIQAQRLNSQMRPKNTINWGLLGQDLYDRPIS